MASTFEEEILEWTLDQDAVQTLLEQGISKWSVTRKQAMDKILEFGKKGYLGFYESLPNREGHRDIAVEAVSLDYIDEHVYTWLSVTPKTIEQLNALYERSRQAPPASTR